MRKIIVLSFISLDGVMQAPGGPEEDKSGGFEHGGWTFPFFDESAGKIMDEQMTPPFDLLLGRKTYDIWTPYWPEEAKKGSSIGLVFNKATKYVVSHSKIDLPWVNSVLIQNDVVSSIIKLKDEDGPDLQVQGSSDLIQTLLRADLVDELWLKIFPVTLGKGKKLFGEGTIPAAFKIIKSSVSPTGVIFANYKRAGEVEVGKF